MLNEALIIVFTGLGAGFLSGLLGIGGGTITIPALILLLGATPHLAQGVSLALIVPTAFIGAYAYYKKGFLHLDKGLLMILGAVLGVFLGANLAAVLPDLALKRLFGVFLIFVSARMFLEK